MSSGRGSIVNTDKPKLTFSRHIVHCVTQASLILAIVVFTLLCSSVQTRTLARETSAQQMIVTTRVEKSNSKSLPFYDALAHALKKRKIKLEGICPPADPVARRILEEYGAVFLATKKVLPPRVCIFTNEDQVTKF